MTRQPANTNKQKVAKVLLQARVDSDLQRQFKAKCALLGRRMNDVLEQLLRDWVGSETTEKQAAAA
jgi:uncharacterized protein (DUF4415 family)